VSATLSRRGHAQAPRDDAVEHVRHEGRDEAGPERPRRGPRQRERHDDRRQQRAQRRQGQWNLLQET
jgi:hypothetical protein